MALKMYVLETDKDSGMKLGVCNLEYYVYFYDEWHKINHKNLDEAKRVFNKICSDYIIDEAKRLNKVTF